MTEGNRRSPDALEEVAQETKRKRGLCLLPMH